MRSIFFFGSFVLCSAKLDLDYSDKVVKDFHEHSKPNNLNEHRPDPQEDFKLEFISKRKDHKTAVSNFATIEEGRRALFIKDVIRNVQLLLETNRKILGRVHHQADDPFPQSGELVQSALSKVLENMALFVDIYSQFPLIVSKAIKSDRKLENVIIWGCQYSLKTRLMDSSTDDLMNTMSTSLGMQNTSESVIKGSSTPQTVSKNGKPNKEKESNTKKNKNAPTKSEL